jgi:hypothetical protein
MLMATGTGCTAGAPVTLSVNGTTLATSTVDAAGHFSAPVDVTVLEVGRYDLVAECGVTLRTPFDVVLVTEAGTGTSSVVIILAILLLGTGWRVRRPNGV